jgi:hypothetical protein
MKRSTCPASLRQQRLATVRLAKAFRANDAAEAKLERTRAELEAAFGKWSVGESITREQARELLEVAGLVERRPLYACAPAPGSEKRA